MKGASNGAEERLCTDSCSDRAKGNGLKLNEGKFRSEIRKKFFTCEGDEAQVAKGSCGQPMFGSVQGQVG